MKSIKISNWINGKSHKSKDNLWLEKINPSTGNVMSYFTDSSKNDVMLAVDSAEKSFLEWSEMSPIDRGNVLFDIVVQMRNNFGKLSKIIAEETGKSNKDAEGEVQASINQANYWASEGMRLYGKSLTSSNSKKHSHTVRVPVGVCGLIVPANTPIANISWKVFPALICGNTVVLKASEDSPQIAYFFAKICTKAGLPNGVLNVIQGDGIRCGAPLVENNKVDLISFTGSTNVGRTIAQTCGKRLAKVSLELGGKNPFLVCDDADINLAIDWAILSSFSNAGQRCASGSRLIIFESIYEEFKSKFIQKAESLKLGINDDCDLGPVINKKQFSNILNTIQLAKDEGGTILCGGKKSIEHELTGGYYIQPTIIEGLPNSSELYRNEIFGPVVTLQKVKSMQEALRLANNTEYGLTSTIHTKNIDRAIWFTNKVKTGVANINLGTFGSEAHMPFGGFGLSGNGTREPGVEALDVYTELKNIQILRRDHLI